MGGFIFLLILVSVIILACVGMHYHNKSIRELIENIKSAERMRKLKYSKYETFLCKDCENRFEADGEVKCCAWERSHDDLLKGKWTEYPTCTEMREKETACGERGYTFKGVGKHYVKPIYYWRSTMYYANK